MQQRRFRAGGVANDAAPLAGQWLPTALFAAARRPPRAGEGQAHKGLTAVLGPRADSAGHGYVLIGHAAEVGHQLGPQSSSGLDAQLQKLRAEGESLGPFTCLHSTAAIRLKSTR